MVRRLELDPDIQRFRTGVTASLPFGITARSINCGPNHAGNQLRTNIRDDFIFWNHAKIFRSQKVMAILRFPNLEKIMDILL